MKHFTASCLTGVIVALQIHSAAASPSPNIFDDFKTAWDDTPSDTSSPNNTATAAAAKYTALTYPGCSSSSSKWCGITISGPAAADNSYNISITNSRCAVVATQTNVREDSSRNFDSSVGRWTFGVDVSGALDLSYNGRNISDPSRWESYGFEVVASSVDHARLFGGISNCTAAGEDGSSKAGPMLSVSGAGWALAAVAGVLVMF